MSEKFVGYFRLLEACREPGCPVCRCVVHDSRSRLRALLYEQVTDPETRRRVRASWGFCNWHTWMLLDVEDALFGASIIYEDLMRSARRRVERLGMRRPAGRLGAWLAALGRRRLPALVKLYRGRPVCPACVGAREAERRYLETLLAFTGDGDLQAAYVHSDGLCVPHAICAVDAAPGDATLRALLGRTLEKWSRIESDVAAFVRKHDHRNREPFSEAETASYRRAFEVLAGAPGVFGSHLGAVADTRARPVEPGGR